MQRRRSRGHRDRDEVAQQREQEQKSGGQTMHTRLTMSAAYQLIDVDGNNGRKGRTMSAEPCR